MAATQGKDRARHFGRPPALEREPTADPALPHFPAYQFDQRVAW